MSERNIQNYYRTLKSRIKSYKSKFKSGRFVKKASLKRREKRDEFKRLDIDTHFSNITTAKIYGGENNTFFSVFDNKNVYILMGKRYFATYNQKEKDFFSKMLDFWTILF